MNTALALRGLYETGIIAGVLTGVLSAKTQDARLSVLALALITVATAGAVHRYTRNGDATGRDRAAQLCNQLSQFHDRDAIYRRPWTHT